MFHKLVLVVRDLDDHFEQVVACKYLSSHDHQILTKNFNSISISLSSFNKSQAANDFQKSEKTIHPTRV